MKTSRASTRSPQKRGGLILLVVLGSLGVVEQAAPLPSLNRVDERELWLERCMRELVQVLAIAASSQDRGLTGKASGYARGR